MSYPSGFIVNGEVTDTFNDRETINRLSGYVMWAKYIWKVFNINPLKCSNCGNQMKFAGIELTDCERKFKEILDANRFLYRPP